MKHAFWLLIGVGFATAAPAQEIHKCLADDSVAYQSAPCGDGQVEARLPKLPDYADPAQRDGASGPAFDSSAAPVPDSADSAPTQAHVPASQAAFPFRTSIALGMTDDQVLNIPAWGRPSRITRTGRSRGWHEAWTYARGDDVRELDFVNGKLAHIDTETAAPAQLAGLTR
jgi:hypothetical protein